MRIIPALVLGIPLVAQAVNPVQERAERFLKVVEAGYQALTYVQQQASWAASTDVKPVHDASAETAGKALAAFNGNPVLILEARDLLRHKDQLQETTWRELEWVLFNAAEGPMTNPRLTGDRIAAETLQASLMNGFTWHLDGKPISANGLDDILASSNDLARRRQAWEASKENGIPLRENLLRLRDLRNGCARELGYPDYFALQVAKHGMTPAEMVDMHHRFLKELRPLYLQLHTWVKYEMAKKYHQPVPRTIPAHWINNRWSQNWTGFVEGVDFDPYFKGWTPEKVVKTAENFYVGLGFPKLPASFWAKSDLYPVPAGSERKKNSHASCWHLDLDTDVRALMSVEPNMEWFGTCHHELGHGYYFISYTNPAVPPLLRTSANPSFHEGIGELIALATRQIPYLKSTGVLPPGYQPDAMKILLNDALEVAIPFMFWASGTMTEWEAEFYGKAMPADKLNERWWQIVKEEQGVEPPSPRDERFCDPATKTHINDTPAYYYNYAMATVFKYQMHDYICRNILHQDVHAADYSNRKDVGAFLKAFMEKGATVDWRKLLKDTTGEDLSTRAMAEYFRPLTQWLETQNKGRQIGWD
ncbi:M2 family metallopeptidase [Mesoterricola silvestris]|uniref:Peptidase M2 n=1 Tax=Mesoterricola silvestris TaxID=2927979 RepID=A0AA48H2X2_9BACT|nr:M2 family metallopeptidase [Mesoterricola silvestris]BDU75028.1 peptidase M2 [Mesoterricola silvestris]